MKNDSKGIALIYVRVSTKTQDPRSQIVRCEEYCERNGYTIEMVFQDRYTGGGDFRERPAMKELLRYARKKGNYHKDYIVVFDDLKRFARDTKFHIDLRTTFNAYGLTPKCLNYNFDESPEGRFMETIHAAQNELERHQNRRQVIQKQRARLIAGYNAFHAPQGYNKIKDKVHGTIDVPNEHAPFIKTALKRFASGEFKRRIDLAEYLKAKGVYGKQDAIKYLHSVNKLCRNVFYAGYIEYPSRDVSRRKGHHKALISLSTYNTIQGLLDKTAKGKPNRKDINPDYPLRGCVNCYYCKRPLTGAKSRGNGGYYKNYFCAYRHCKLRKMAVRKSVSIDTLHAEFKSLVSSFQPTEELLKLTIAVMKEVWNINLEERDSLAKEQVKEKVKLEHEIENMIRLIANPDTSESLRKRYEVHIETLDKKVQEIVQKTEEPKHLSENLRTASLELIESFKNPYKIWETGDFKSKKKLFYFIFDENLEYDPSGGFRTIKKSLPIRLFEEIGASNSLHVEMDGKTLNLLHHFITRWQHHIKSIS